MRLIDRRRLGRICSILPLLWAAAAAAATPAPLGGDFRLTGHDGEPWSSEEARGKVVVLAFGYTFCPDICPTALATVAAAMTALGPDAERVQPIFVSLDPKRDTPERLRGYVEWFHPRMIGLTGSAEELADVADRYRVRYRFNREPDAGYYTLDHGASLYVVDPQGRLARILPHGLPPSALVDAVGQLLDEGAGEGPPH
jgi:cytochrome oxidase Cu insertion factor (SCO1/SenC/PrrC family)